MRKLRGAVVDWILGALGTVILALLSFVAYNLTTIGYRVENIEKGQIRMEDRQDEIRSDLDKLYGALNDEVQGR